MLTREQILAIEDRPTRVVEVPEWDTTVYVRQFSGRERFEYERLISKPDVSETDVVIATVALATVDENGERRFSAEDIPALEAKNFRALFRIAKAALAFNNLSDDEVAEAGNA